MKKLLLSLFLVLLAAATASAFGLGSSKFKEEVEKEASGIKLAGEVQSGGYGLISTAQLEELIASGEDVLVIDTMPFEASYKKGHIPTAKNFLFPIPEMKEWDAKETDGKSVDDYRALLGPDKDRKIVVYCGFVKCTRSHNGALWAVKLGYTNVMRQPGGIYAWKGAGYEVEASE